MNKNEEIKADIRNRLTPAKTALDLLSKGKDVPKKFVEMALKDLNMASELINNLEGTKMPNRYGYAFEKWNTAKEEMRQILIGIAKAEQKIVYSELVAKVKIIILQPESYALADMLEEISREENVAGHGMLSVVVVHKSGDMQPGVGFFELAEELGRDTSDRTKCWIEEFKRVCIHWSATIKVRKNMNKAVGMLNKQKKNK